MLAMPLKLIFTGVALCALGAAAWITHSSRENYSDISGLESGSELVRTQPVTDLTGAIDPEADSVPAAQQPDSELGLDRLEAHLNRENFEHAVQLYSDVYSALSEAESDQYRTAILDRSRQFSSDGEHTKVISLLSKYTGLFFKDVPALKLLAYSQHQLQFYADEIETLLLALNEAHLQQDIQKLNQALEYAVIAQDLAYVQDNDPESAVAFYQDLLLKRPDSAQLHLGLIRSIIRTGDIDSALTALDSVPNAADHLGKIARLREMALASRPANGTLAPLRRAGNGFIVEARINASVRVNLLIDTGASLTIIRPQALRRAGIGSNQINSIRTLLTAGGDVKTPIYQLDSLSVGGETVARIDVGSIDLSGLKGIDGLLGMNYLSHFKITVNQDKPAILLLR